MNSMPLGDILSLLKCMQRDFVFVRIPNGMRKLMLLSFSTELESLWDFTSFFHLIISERVTQSDPLTFHSRILNLTAMVKDVMPNRFRTFYHFIATGIYHFIILPPQISLIFVQIYIYLSIKQLSSKNAQNILFLSRRCPLFIPCL